MLGKNRFLVGKNQLMIGKKSVYDRLKKKNGLCSGIKRAIGGLKVDRFRFCSRSCEIDLLAILGFWLKRPVYDQQPKPVCDW